MTSHVDRSFDHLFQARTGLPWWPWVGAQFRASAVRTMIVGESVYVWTDKDPAAFARRYASVEGLRETHARHAMNVERNARFVRNIERAIFAAKRPAPELKTRLWQSVVYHNLVLRPMASPQHRPSEDDYRAGWIEVLALCRLLGIEQCLVYGLESSKLRALKDVLREHGSAFEQEDRPARIGAVRPHAGSIGLDDRRIRMLFVRHPSAFFSWRAWAPLIEDRLALRGALAEPIRIE